MLLRLLDSYSYQAAAEVEVPAMSYDTRDSTFSIPGGSLLVVIRAVAKPLSISFNGKTCTLQFRTMVDALEFAEKGRAANRDTQVRNEQMLD